MKSVQHSLEIQGTASDVYTAWTDFEHFPRFMPSILEVQRLDANRLTKVDGGIRRPSNAMGEPDFRIDPQSSRRLARSWRGIRAGATTIEEIEPGRTRLTLQTTYTPAAPWGGIDEGVMKDAIAADLARFKLLFEGARPARA